MLDDDRYLIEVFAETMETHAHEQVRWQAPRASVATTEVLKAGALAAIAAG